MTTYPYLCHLSYLLPTEWVVVEVVVAALFDLWTLLFPLFLFGITFTFPK
jgi:hypothetical protein